MGDINNAQLVDAAHEAIRTNDLAPIAQLLQDNQDTHVPRPDQDHAAPPQAAPGPAKVAVPLAQLEGEDLKLAHMYACIALSAYENEKAKVQQILESCPLLAGHKYLFDVIKFDSNILIDLDTPIPTRLDNNKDLQLHTDTELLVLVLPSTEPGGRPELVFGFRGTETHGEGHVSDIVTDALAYQTPLVGGLAGISDKYKGIQVHKGFLTSFRDVVEGNGHLRLADGLSEKAEHNLEKTALQLLDGATPSRVVCCGHSLGAALATLGAFWAQAVRFKETDVHCFAFASPRVGNAEFAKQFDSLVRGTKYRFTHKRDIVPAVPPPFMPVLGKYQHVSPVVFLCQPKKEDYSMLTKQQKKDITSSLAKEDYVALLKERPWMPILELSVDDHSMTNYVGGLENIIARTGKSQVPAVAAKVAAAAVTVTAVATAAAIVTE